MRWVFLIACAIPGVVGFVFIDRLLALSPWLGIPVKWTAISEAKVIVECGLENFRVEPSQGTHFFQNLTSFGVGYMTISPFLGDGAFDAAQLDGEQAVYESELVRHVRFTEPLYIYVDGRKNKGIIRKG